MILSLSTCPVRPMNLLCDGLLVSQPFLELSGHDSAAQDHRGDSPYFMVTEKHKQVAGVGHLQQQDSLLSDSDLSFIITNF